MVGGSCQEESIAEFNAHNLLLLGSRILAALLHLPLEVCMKCIAKESGCFCHLPRLTSKEGHGQEEKITKLKTGSAFSIIAKCLNS